MADKKDLTVRIKGIDKVIKKDLERHKQILVRTQDELQAFRQSVSYLIQRKKHFSALIGGDRYDDDALREAVKGINIDIRAMSDKVKLTLDALDHHGLIVDTLTAQLEEYYESLAEG